MDFKTQIKKEIQKVLVELGIGDIEPQLEHPVQEEYGDYSTNVAMKAFGKTEKWASPMELARKIASQIQASRFQILSRVDAAPPGFINFWLSKDALLGELSYVAEKGKSYGKTRAGKRETIVLEHTSPNTNKPLHIGHIRNNV